MLGRKKKNNIDSMKIFNEWGTDVSPKRLVDEKLISIETFAAKCRLEHHSTQDEVEWFRRKVHREERQPDFIPRKETKLKTENGAEVPVRMLTTADIEQPSLKPEKLFLRLSETRTTWLLSISSNYSQEDPQDVVRVQKENENYAELTTGKGMSRKRSTAETQTARCTEKSKNTATGEIKMRDSFVNASAWDLYDTYTQIGGAGALGVKEFQMLITAGLKMKGFAAEGSQTPHAIPDDNILNLIERSEFRYALLITERLLASNNFQLQQSVFKKASQGRYDLTETSAFSYTIDELWVFDYDFQFPMTVTALDWNSYNPDLLAVGYGHFYFGDGNTGLVCVWSPKNPGHPEREFLLEDSVTSLSFSKVRPNILAVGCRNGDVYVLDVSTESKKLRLLGRDKIKHRHGPVWKIEWFLHKEVVDHHEELLALGEGGFLIRFTFPDDNETSELLKFQYTASITKSHFHTLRKGSSKKASEGLLMTHTTFATLSLSGLWFSLTCNGTLCYVATKEGTVIRCILRSPYRTDLRTLAHDGPIYNIQHSPFTEAIYLTCGADWCLRVWIDGIEEPLLTLKTSNPIVSARWSPTVSTIIATLSGKELALWDIARKVNSPVKVLNYYDQKKPFSSLLFSPKGTNIVLGDQQGLVRVLHLSHLPRQPFLQPEALTGAVQRALFTNQKLLHKFNKVVEITKERLKTQVDI